MNSVLHNAWCYWMKAVSRFEVNLLRVLHALLHRAPVLHVMPLLTEPLPRPKCLSRNAVALVQDALAKGCVHFLAQRGWMSQRFLRSGTISEGRLWQRTPPHELGLTFTRQSLEFLLQLVSGTLDAVPDPAELSVGDRFLFFLSFAVLRGTNIADAVRKKWQLHQDGLCRLAFPDDIMEGTPKYRIDWHVWTEGIGAGILETLQEWLGNRWVQVESKKSTFSTVARMTQLGNTQERVYGEYLDALTTARRWDLARCFLDAGKQLLRDQPTANKWINKLDVSKERIADRLTIYYKALAFLRQMDRLQKWQQQALGVGYFDEGYQASQLWKADWERYGGDQICECARNIVREVEPMK